MTEEQDEHGAAGAGDAAGACRLRVVRGPLEPADPGDAPPPVRLLREFKGLTVSDEHREQLARRLPGQVRSALAHLEAGDLAEAERALDAALAAVLPGPGHRRCGRWGWFAAGALAAVAIGWALARWLTG